MMKENKLQHKFDDLLTSSWNAIYTQGGVLSLSKNASVDGCSVSSLLIIGDSPYWIYADDSGIYKEVELGIEVSIDEQFGMHRHERLFKPKRTMVNSFPECCRLDLFLDEKLSVNKYIFDGVDQQLLNGVLLNSNKGNCLGIFIDEDIPGNLLLTTDCDSIKTICN